VFYFQQLLSIALSGIDKTGIIFAVTNVAYGILLIGFLIGLYQAVMRGGDVQALGVTAIKYLVVAIIIANWATVFRDVNGSFNSVAQFIGNTSGAGDMFLSWMDQLGQQFSGNNASIWDIITGDIAAALGTLLIVIAYIVYAIAIIVFCFFYALYGAVLYVLGPLVLALLPMSGVGQLGRSFATNVMLWNAWGIIYAVLGALITAIQVNQVSQVGGGGFLGFLRGPFDTLILGLVSICYALAIALIPAIAKRLISGDVGATAMTMLNAATTAAGIAIAGATGLAGGISAGSAGGARRRRARPRRRAGGRARPRPSRSPAPASAPIGRPRR
jgi:F420-0:gamma-glutamyl ligase-like protein